jgi:dihydrofolate reductase
MKLICCAAASLDGFIADAAGSSSFVSPADVKQFKDLVAATGTLIVGRRAFEQWHQQNPLPQVHTYVLTKDASLSGDNEAIRFVAGGVLEVMRQLQEDGRAHAVLWGGGQVNGAFAAKDLIDEARISLYPLILGQGVPLMGGYQGQLRLQLQKAYTLPDGVVRGHYAVN